jgi:DNA repair exonuclease SbcCD ATPase subunit
VEQITGAEIYGEIYSEVVSLLKSASQVMDKLTGERAQAANNVTKLNERSKQVTGEIVEAMRNQKQGMAELKLRLASLVDRRGVLSVEIEQVEKFEQANELAFGEMAAKVDEAARSASALERKLNQTSYIYSTTKDRLDEQIKTMDGGACPTCGQDLAFTLISVRVKEMRGELASLSNKVADIRREHSESMGVLRLAEQDLDSIPRPADLRKAREDKQQALRSLEKEIDELKAEMHKRRTALDGLKAVRKEVDEQFSSAMAELDFIDEQIETQKHELYALDWLVSAFSTKGIRAKVLSTVTMPYLNSRVERYSERFGLPVKLTNEVETKGGKIENKLDVALAGRLTYRGCSRGQKRKVDLAIQKAFNDLATKTGGFVNLLVGDEIIDPLDDEATQIFIELLREESAGKTILLMTHKKFVEADADHRMHLTLVDGETKILEV